MFQDEARFGLISDARRCWCPKPLRPICGTKVTQQYTYVYGAVSVADGRMDSLVLPYANSLCMGLFLKEISGRYPKERIVMVLDGAGWHRSNSLEIPENIRLLSLPPYSPELNPVEHIWEEVREKYFHNLVFKDIDSLEDQLIAALCTLEADLERVKSIVAWPWIINVI